MEMILTSEAAGVVHLRRTVPVHSYSVLQGNPETRPRHPCKLHMHYQTDVSLNLFQEMLNTLTQVHLGNEDEKSSLARLLYGIRLRVLGNVLVFYRRVECTHERRYPVR